MNLNYENKTVKPELCNDPEQAAQWLRRGGLVAFPTETVYGLGVNAMDSAAVERLFSVKGRPSNNPLIVHIADIGELEQVGQRIPAIAFQLLERFSPGPLTVVVPKRPEIVASVSAGLDTVGVRIPAEENARAMLRAAQLPIAAPSANRSGRPSCTTYESVLEDFGADIDAILVGGVARIGLESTVVDCTPDVPRVLRPGGISLEQLQSVDRRITAAGRDVVPGENSPGRMHPHYQPQASVHLVSDPSEAICTSQAAYLGLTPHKAPEQFGWHWAFDSIDQYARSFYEALREVDRRGLSTVYCQRVPSAGLGIALSDRLERAAE